MNLLAKMLYRRKLAGWIITGLAALALGTVGAGRVLADDDDDSDKGEAWLGVALQDLTPSLREALNLDRQVKGVMIAGVMPGSPAEKIGLEDRDVIVTLNGRNVQSVDDATEVVQKLDPGDKLTVSVLRDSRRRQFTATLTERHRGEDSDWLGGLEQEPGPDAPNVPYPPDAPNAPMPPRMAHPDDLPEGGHRGYLGVTTIELGEQLADYFGVNGGGGVLVTEVAKDSPADEAGLKAGDVILSVSDSKVDNPGDLMRLVRAHDPQDKIEVVVQRRGHVETLHARLGEAKDLGMFAPRGHRGFMMSPEMRQHMMMIGPQIRQQLHEHLRMMQGREGGGSSEI